MRIPSYFLYVTLIFLLLLPFGKAVAGWNSFIVNFDKSLYGKGAQTWKIAPYDDHWVYFANKNGMVQFDGNVWTVFPMNNFSDVRSVLASTTQKRIYAGGINEFGYYEPSEDGSWSIIVCPIRWKEIAVLLVMSGESTKLIIFFIYKATIV